MPQTSPLSQPSEYLEFQGSQVANIPERPGLYAWYYRPAVVNPETTVNTLARFFTPESSVTTVVRQRYGMKLVSRAMGEVVFGADQQPLSATVSDAFDKAGSFLQWFFRCPQFVQFSRPVYIGIARDLYDRVYNQHFLSLTDYWDDHSRVSRFISANSQASVQTVMDSLDMPHSFALEARVRGISSTDLMASVLPTDDMPVSIGSDNSPSESATRRSLERFLQLLSDPLCGRL